MAYINVGSLCKYRIVDLYMHRDSGICIFKKGGMYAWVCICMSTFRGSECLPRKVVSLFVYRE